MISPVYKVKEYDTVRAVIEKFIDHRISGLPVINDRNEIKGYVSDGDIMRYIGKHDDMIISSLTFTAVVKGDEEAYDERVRKLMKVNVMEIGKKKPVTVPWDEEVENIAAILGRKQIKKVPVERNGVLVGIISRGDIIRHSFKYFM
jgi:CBS domain-containing protein